MFIVDDTEGASQQVAKTVVGSRPEAPHTPLILLTPHAGTITITLIGIGEEMLQNKKAIAYFMACVSHVAKPTCVFHFSKELGAVNSSGVLQGGIILGVGLCSGVGSYLGVGL